jgi:hypothetical protein
VIRCMPGEDKTNGFFVACFVKASSLPPVTRTKEKATKSNGKKRARAADQTGDEQEISHAATAVVQADQGEGEDAERVKKAGGAVETKEAKAKTDAQKARKRRKKQAQKERQ